MSWLLDKIVPDDLLVTADAQRLGNVFGLMLDILVEIGIFAEIAEVPVEGGIVLPYAGGDGGHDHVAAIARITRDGKRPGGVIRGGLRTRGAGKPAKYEQR